MRLGLLVASGALAPSDPHTSDIRRSFAQVLGAGRMGALIADLTATEGRQWSAWDPRGRISFSAILATGDDDPAPVAWARFTPADPEWAGYGRDPRCAELTVYVQPRDENGPAPSQGIARWHRRFAASLDALAEFADRMLAGELRLEVTDDPAMKAAVWLEADPDLTELVGTTGARRLPGSMVRKEFGGYAVADPSGSSASNSRPAGSGRCATTRCTSTTMRRC
ncbi:hypothetical protein ACFQ9X_31310 [Catenulispora yoronensis]